MAGSDMLGVLGGMGPAATADFLAKLVAVTPATCDQDHIPVAVINDPRVPDRTRAVLDGREDDVFDALAAGLRRLEAIGADAFVMPCNSAHHWAERLQATTTIPLIHMADASLAETRARLPDARRIAVLATSATLRSGFYPRKMVALGLTCADALDDALQADVMTGIRRVKAGEIDAAHDLLADVAERVFAGGADAILLACTELPIALAPELARDPRLVDTTLALAKACAQRRLERLSLRAEAPPC